MLEKPLTLAATLAGEVGLYFRYLRRRHMTWGATQTEATGPLPGDELVPYADIVATRVRIKRLAEHAGRSDERRV